MPGIAERAVREQLLARRARLGAIVQLGVEDRVVELLKEIDLALERVEAGSFGLCDVCHDPIEGDRLLRDPLVRVCLGCLTPDQSRALERDLETAAQIQAGLLPARDMTQDAWQISYHYEPIGPVSGDYCDIIPPTPAHGDLYFLFGDVSGKGVSASLLMAHLHAMFRALIALDLPLADLIQRAHRLFGESTLPNQYATLVVGRLSPSGEVEMCNAAHCPPLVVRGDQVSALGPTGWPLGLFPSGSFETHRLKLGAGDLLFLYTDGLSEAQNEIGDEYGDERISRTLQAARARSAAGAIRACLEDFTSFTNHAPRHDDLTVMAIRRAQTA